MGVSLSASLNRRRNPTATQENLFVSSARKQRIKLLTRELAAFLFCFGASLRLKFDTLQACAFVVLALLLGRSDALQCGRSYAIGQELSTRHNHLAIARLPKVCNGRISTLLLAHKGGDEFIGGASTRLSRIYGGARSPARRIFVKLHTLRTSGQRTELVCHIALYALWLAWRRGRILVPRNRRRVRTSPHRRTRGSNSHPCGRRFIFHYNNPNDGTCARPCENL